MLLHEALLFIVKFRSRLSASEHRHVFKACFELVYTFELFSLYAELFLVKLYVGVVENPQLFVQDGLVASSNSALFKSRELALHLLNIVHLDLA